jgi:hypothetical protein
MDKKLAEGNTGDSPASQISVIREVGVNTGIGPVAALIWDFEPTHRFAGL